MDTNPPGFREFLEEQKVYLNGLCLPPTENSLYPTFNGRRIKSKALLQFQRDIHYWRMLNKTTALQARETCQFWIQKGYFLKVSALVFFKKEKIFTKDGRVKQLDASNRMKALHDAISDQILSIDDRYFWSVSIEKVVGDKEGVNVIIEPIRCQFMSGGIPQKPEELSAGP